MYGSFQELYAGVSKINKDIIDTYDGRLSGNTPCKRGSFRVERPTMQVFQKLIQASRVCTTHPNTLGVDTKLNSVYAVKTIGDLKLMLQYLAEDKHVPDSTPPGKLSLLRLGYPKGVF
jgi:hypothetical protein